MEIGISPELVGAAISVGAFFLLVILLTYAIRRARRARQREIMAAGEDRLPSRARSKRSALRAEDVVPEEGEDEDVVAEPSPDPMAEVVTPPPEPRPVGPAAG